MVSLTIGNCYRQLISSRIENLSRIILLTLSGNRDTTLPEEPLHTKADLELIEQVLINLVKNALEAVKEENTRKILLSALKENNRTILSVKDTGSGIPQDQMESIFVPFFTTKEAGTGIGLSFSQHIMRLHKGYIRVSSNPGKGSVFQLVFRL